MKIKNNVFEKVRLIIYILSIVIAIIVFSTGYEGSCYWREHYGILCPTCGFTRATINFMKLDFKNAISYNAFYTCILLPFILYLVINDMFVIIKRDDISYVEIILGGAIVKYDGDNIV